MASPKCLLGPKDRRDNEFYTLYSSVEYVFNNVDGLKEYVKDKVLYLPCDTEESNIYKYLINNKEKLQIKEILHTSDDYYSHHDLYRKADIVITNPPFTKICKWILFLYEMNKEFIIWAPYTAFQYKVLSDYVIKDLLKCICLNAKELNYFERPDGSIKYVVSTVIISNILEFKSFSKKLKIDPKNTIEYLKQNDKIVYYNDIPILKVIKDFPYDYNGAIYIGCTAVMDYRNEFVFTDSKHYKNFVNFGHTINVEGLNRKDCYKVYRKGEDAKLEDSIQNDKINKLF